MLNTKIRDLLICPCCAGKLTSGSKLSCDNCKIDYPVVNDIPILINENNSIFKTEQFIKKEFTTINFAKFNKGFIRRILRRLIPSNIKNFKARENFNKFYKFLDETDSKSSIVLVLGGSMLGTGMNELIEKQNITFIETDVSLGFRTQVICDAHNIPFANESLDGVIIQAVLEHVIDPYRCVEEIYRVLKLGGLVYSEVPFMQQVHLGQYDFTRFTDLGHRRLFKKFEEIERGIAGGPAATLVWSISYFLMSFTDWPVLRKYLGIISNCLFFWLKYFDYFLIHKISSYCSASGFYFLGKKTGSVLCDRELIKLYRGIR